MKNCPWGHVIIFSESKAEEYDSNCGYIQTFSSSKTVNGTLSLELKLISFISANMTRGLSFVLLCDLFVTALTLIILPKNPNLMAIIKMED